MDHFEPYEGLPTSDDSNEDDYSGGESGESEEVNSEDGGEMSDMPTRARLLAFTKQAGLWITVADGLQVLELGDGTTQPRVVGSQVDQRQQPRRGKEPMTDARSAAARANTAIAALRAQCPLSQCSGDDYLVDRFDEEPAAAGAAAVPAAFDTSVPGKVSVPDLEGGEAELYVYPLHGRSICGHDRLIVVRENRLRLVVVSPDHLSLHQTLQDVPESGRSDVQIELNRRELIGLLWYIDWNDVFEDNAAAAVPLASFFESIALSAHANCWLRATAFLECRSAVLALEALGSYLQKPLTSRPPNDPAERARFNEVFAVVATLGGKVRAATEPIDDQQAAKLDMLLPRWSSELARLASLAHAPDLRCSARRLANLGFYQNESSANGGAGLRRVTGLRAADRPLKCDDIKAACSTDEMPWGLAYSVPLSSAVATQQPCVHSSGEEVEFFASSIIAPQWALTGSTDGEIAVWSTLLGLQRAAEFNCRLQRQLDQEWLTGPMVGVHLLCHPLPLGAICVMSVFNTDVGPVVRVHSLAPHLGNFISGGSSGSALADKFVPPAVFQCRLCASERSEFTSHPRLAQHMVEKHAEQAQLFENYVFNEAVWLLDHNVLLNNVFASAVLESASVHSLLLAATTEVGEPIIAVGSVQDFLVCCHHPTCEVTADAANKTLLESWKYHSLDGYVDRDLWDHEGHVHIEAIGEPFSCFVALLVNARTSVILVNTETGAVLPVYATNAGEPAIADFDVDMVRGVVGVVLDDGSLASAMFVIETHDELQTVDESVDNSDLRANQLEQSHRILQMSPVPVVKLLADAPGHCSWKLTGGPNQRFSAEFEAIVTPVSAGRDVPRRSLELACHFREQFFVTAVRLECAFALAPTSVRKLPRVAVRFVANNAVQEGSAFAFNARRRPLPPGEAVVLPMSFTDNALSVVATQCVILRFEAAEHGETAPALPFRVRVFFSGPANVAVLRNTLAIPRTITLDFSNFDALYPELLAIIAAPKPVRRLRDAAVALLHTVLVRFKRRKHIVRIAELASFEEIIINSIVLTDHMGPSKTLEFLIELAKMLRLLVPSTPCPRGIGCSAQTGWCRKCLRCTLQFVMLDGCLKALKTIKSQCRSSCSMTAFFKLLRSLRGIDDPAVSTQLLRALMEVSQDVHEALHAAPIYAQLKAQCDSTSDYIFEPSCFTLRLGFESGLSGPMEHTPRMFGRAEPITMAADPRSRGVDLLGSAVGEHLLSARHRLLFRSANCAVLDLQGRHRLTHFAVELPDGSEPTRITIAVGSSSARHPDDEIFSETVEHGKPVVFSVPNNTVCCYVAVGVVVTEAKASETVPGDAVSSRFHRFEWKSTPAVLVAAYGIPICDDSGQTDDAGAGMQTPLLVLQRLRAQDAEARRELEHRQRALKRMMSKPQSRSANASVEAKRMNTALQAARLAMAQVFCARWAWVRFAEENASYGIEAPPLLDCRLSRLSSFTHAAMDAVEWFHDGPRPLPPIPESVVVKLFNAALKGSSRLETHGIRMLKKLPISKWTWSRVLINSLQLDEWRGGGISSALAQPRYALLKDLALALGFREASPANPLLLAIVEMVILWIQQDKMEVILLAGSFKLFLDVMADVEPSSPAPAAPQQIGSTSPTTKRLRIQVIRSGDATATAEYDMNPNLPLEMLIVRYTSQKCVLREDIEFKYMGQQLPARQTPAQLKMSNGAVVMVGSKKSRRPDPRVSNNSRTALGGVTYRVPSLPRLNCRVRVAPDAAAEVIGHYTEGSKLLAVDFQGDWMKVLCSMKDKGSVWSIDRATSSFFGWVRHTVQGAELVKLDTTSQAWSSFATVRLRTPDGQATVYTNVCRKTCFAVLLSRFANERDLNPADFYATCKGRRVWGYQSVFEFNATDITVVLQPPVQEIDAEFITLRVISTATYLHREVDSTAAPQPKESVETMFVKFSTSSSLGSLSTIYSTQESTCPNMLTIRYNDCVRKHDDTAAKLKMADMSTVRLNVPREDRARLVGASARDAGRNMSLELAEAANHAKIKSNIIDTAPDERRQGAPVDNRMAMASNLIPAQLFGILAHPAVSKPVRPIIFALITTTLMKMFGSCDMPSLVSILQHQEMPGFLHCISTDRSDDARDRVKQLIQGIMAVTLNLLGAMTGARTSAVLIHPSPVGFFVRSVCTMIDKSLANPVTHVGQLIFLLEVLLPHQAVLAQRSDLHPHHATCTPKPWRGGTVCTCCKAAIPAAHIVSSRVCAEHGCDFAVCGLCSSLPTVAHVLEYLSEASVLRLVEIILPKALHTDDDQRRCSMVLQFAAHVVPTSLVESESWWRAVALVVMSGNPSLLWRVRTILNAMCVDASVAHRVQEELNMVVLQCLDAIDAAACKGLWQMTQVLCELWSTSAQNDGEVRAQLNRYFVLIVAVMKHIFDYGIDSRRSDVGEVNMWLSCIYFLLTRCCRNIVLPPDLQFDEGMMAGLGYIMTVVPLRYEEWSTRSRAADTEPIVGPSEVNLILRTLHMSGFKELDNCRQAPFESGEFQHHTLRMLGGSSMMIKFLILPHNDYFSAEILAEATARLSVNAVRSGAFSLVLTSLNSRGASPIFVRHLGPIVLELIHNVATVLSGVAPLVQVPSFIGGDDALPSLESCLTSVQRALHFLQIVGLHTDIGCVVNEVASLDTVIDDLIHLIPHFPELVGDILANVASYHKAQSVNIVTAAVNAVHLPQSKVYSEVIEHVVSAVRETPFFDVCATVLYKFLMSNPYEMFTSLGPMMRVFGMMNSTEDPRKADLTAAILDKAVQYVNYSFQSMSEEMLYSIARSAVTFDPISSVRSKVASDLALKFSYLLAAMESGIDNECGPDREKYVHALQWILRSGTRVQATRRHGAVIKGHLGTFISSSAGVCWDAHAPATELVPYEVLEVVSESNSSAFFSRRAIISCVDPPVVSEHGVILPTTANLTFGQIVAIVSETSTHVVVRNDMGTEFMLAPEVVLQIQYVEDLLIEPAEVKACRGAMAIIASILREQPHLIDGFVQIAQPQHQSTVKSGSAALEHLVGALIMSDEKVRDVFLQHASCGTMCESLFQLTDSDSLRGLRSVLPTLRLFAHASLKSGVCQFPEAGYQRLNQLSRMIAAAAQTRHICPYLEERAHFFIGLILRNFDVASPDAFSFFAGTNTWQTMPPGVAVRLFWHLDVVTQVSPTSSIDISKVECDRGILKAAGQTIRIGETVAIEYGDNRVLLWGGKLSALARGFLTIEDDIAETSRWLPYTMFNDPNIHVSRAKPVSTADISAAVASPTRTPAALVNTRLIAHLATSGDLSKFFNSTMERFEREPLGSATRLPETARVVALQTTFRANRGELRRSCALLSSAFRIPGFAQQLLQSRVGASVALALAGYFDPRKCTAIFPETSLEEFVIGEVKTALMTDVAAKLNSATVCKILKLVLQTIGDQTRHQERIGASFDSDDVHLHAAYNCAMVCEGDGIWQVSPAQPHSVVAAATPHVVVQAECNQPASESRYFEVVVLECTAESATLAVGLLPPSSSDVSLVSDSAVVVPTKGVWCTMGGAVWNDGRAVCAIRPFKSGDTVGCGVDYKSKLGFFTANGAVVAAFNYSQSQVCLAPAVALQGELKVQLVVQRDRMRCSAMAMSSRALLANATPRLPALGTSDPIAPSKWLKVEQPTSILLKKTAVDVGGSTDDTTVPTTPNHLARLLTLRLELVTQLVADRVQSDILDLLRKSALPLFLLDMMSIESCTTVNAKLDLYQHVVKLVDAIFPAAFPDPLVKQMETAIKALGSCSVMFLRTREGALRACPGTVSATVMFAQNMCGLMMSIGNRSSRASSLSSIGPFRSAYEVALGGHRMTSGEIDATYAFAAKANDESTVSQPKAERLMSEVSDLAKSLPCDPTHAIFGRYDESRFDKMQVLITGAADTPYNSGCFLFDVFCPAGYPERPPLVELITTGRGTLRFNPNLYMSGKVCLSLLGTWEGDATETWTQTSSLLQVFTAIQSLIMHNNVYSNEPSAPTADGGRLNAGYCNIIRYGTVKYGVTDHIIGPSSSPFRKLILKHLFLQRERILEVHQTWVKDAEAELGFVENLKPLYSGLVELHNRELARHFAQTPAAYITALKQEVLCAREALLGLVDIDLSDDEGDDDDDDDDDALFAASDDDDNDD